MVYHDNLCRSMYWIHLPLSHKILSYLSMLLLYSCTCADCWIFVNLRHEYFFQFKIDGRTIFVDLEWNVWSEYLVLTLFPAVSGVKFDNLVIQLPFNNLEHKCVSVWHWLLLLGRLNRNVDMVPETENIYALIKYGNLEDYNIGILYFFILFASKYNVIQRQGEAIHEH